MRHHHHVRSMLTRTSYSMPLARDEHTQAESLHREWMYIPPRKERAHPCQNPAQEKHENQLIPPTLCVAEEDRCASSTTLVVRLQVYLSKYRLHRQPWNKSVSGGDQASAWGRWSQTALPRGPFTSKKARPHTEGHSPPALCCGSA